MLKCSRGYVVTGANATDVEAVDRFRARLIRMEGGADFVLDAALEAPGCALLQIYAALFWLHGATRAAYAQAIPWIERAETVRAGISGREAQLLAAAKLWLAGDPEATMDMFESITESFPRDQVAAKSCEFNQFIVGQHFQAARFLAHMERIAEANADTSDIIAMRAFANELSGNYDEARRHAEHAIKLHYATPWAHHALAHIALVNDDIESGLAEQNAFLSTWNQPGPTIHGHNSWHLALLRLQAGDTEGSLALLDGRIWGALTESITEQTDTISLLWRIEMDGGQVRGGLWAEIAAACAPLAGDALLPFVSAHHAYAFSRAEGSSALEELRASAARAGREGSEARRRVWGEVGIPAIEAGVAAAQGDSAGVVRSLLGVFPELPRLGGSDAQGDLWRQALVYALVNLGRDREARALLPLFPGNRRASRLLEARALSA
ncbi:MAG: hypothetical protein VCC00_03760 [Deltaproteobacteria bacterium]